MGREECCSSDQRAALKDVSVKGREIAVDISETHLAVLPPT